MNLLDAYRYLAALAQHRHFGRAAQACHVTQPALSNALRALESQLGVAIVRRGRQFEGFTPEGELVLATAWRMLAEQEALQQGLQASAGQPSGRLVIGAVPTAVPVAARFAAALVERYPAIQPELRALASQDIDTGLETLAVDLGLGYLERLDQRKSGARLRAWPQYEERTYLVGLRPQAAKGRKAVAVPQGPVTWAQAAECRLCLLTPEMHHRHRVDEAFRIALEGGVPVPTVQASSVLGLLALVQTQGLHALLPGALLGLVGAMPQLLVRPLVSPDLRTPMGFITLADRPVPLALRAALALAEDPHWLDSVQAPAD